MFQINGDKSETKSKKKGNVLTAFLHACLFYDSEKYMFAYLA